MDHPEDDYFSAGAVRREVLVWVVATRRQLDRWETLVASILRSELPGHGLPPREVWQAETERHFALIAAAHVLRAMRLPGWAGGVDTKTLEVLTDLRNTLEHWDENLPIFSTTPREDDPPRSSGRRLVDAEPHAQPFRMFAWGLEEGPVLWPGLPTSVVRDVMDEVETHVLSEEPELARFIPPRVESPWLREEAGRDMWWPKSEETE